MISSIFFVLTFSLANAYVRLPFTATAPSGLRSAVASGDNAFSSSLPMGVSWDWQEVASLAFDEDDRAIILFDGKCNLCNGGVNFALDHDSRGTTHSRIYVHLFHTRNQYL
jgi:hypothetical protein